MRRAGALLSAALATVSVRAPAQSRAPAPESLGTPEAGATLTRGPRQVLVQGARPSSPNRQLLSAERAREGAGTQGDPVKGLQGLPGLGRGGIGGGEIVSWGSPPSESRIELDGIEIPLLYHGSGVRSVVPAGIVDAVAIVPGGFDAEHGRALGGLVTLSTRPADMDAQHWRASVDMLDASALASTPLEHGESALQLGVRYGYVDRWLPQLIAPELRGLYRVPQYWDAQAEAGLRLRQGETVRLVFSASSDECSSQLTSQDPARAREERLAQGFGRLYLVYRAFDSRGGETRVTPFVGWDRQQQTVEQAQQPSQLSSHALHYGLRAVHRDRVSRSVALSFGVDAEGSLGQVERLGSLSVPRREGDPYPFGTPPGSAVASDDFRTHVLGLATFVETELRAGGLSVVPALRFEPLLLEASRTRPPLGDLPDKGTSRLEALLEPRISVEGRVSPRLRLFASVGRYHQPPAPAELGARFGNPLLGASSATHLSLGETAQLFAGTRLELTVFSKWLDGLPTRSLAPEPRLAEALVGTGQGRAFGTQLFLRQAERHGFSGWLGATLSRSERAGADGVWRLSDYDSPLVVGATILKRYRAWRFGARARFASGLPRTPVSGAYYDLGSQSHQPILGPTNSARLRDFFQLDLRIDRGFELGTDTRLELYLDMLNVTFQKNEEEWAYASDFSSVASVSSLPPLAIVGVTIER